MEEAALLLPSELWSLILHEVIVLENAQCSFTPGKKKKPREIPRHKWKVYVQLMFVCKEWKQFVWSQVRVLSMA